MKQTEQAPVTLNLSRNQASRIATQFANRGDIARLLLDAVNIAVQQNPKAPDDALIPVNVEVSKKQARTIFDQYKHLDGPTDGAIYSLVKKAIEEA